MRTLANEAAAPRRRRARRRSPRCSARSTSSRVGETEHGNVQVRRRHARRHEGEGGRRGAERGRAAQRADAARLPKSSRSSRRSRFSQIEITKERVPRQVIMHFSRQLAAFVRGGIPITDALDSRARRARRTSASGRDPRRGAGGAARRTSRSPRRCRVARVGVPAVLPRASCARPSTPAGSTSCSTSSPTTWSATSRRSSGCGRRSRTRS